MPNENENNGGTDNEKGLLVFEKKISSELKIEETKQGIEKLKREIKTLKSKLWWAKLNIFFGKKKRKELQSTIKAKELSLNGRLVTLKSRDPKTGLILGSEHKKPEDFIEISNKQFSNKQSYSNTSSVSTTSTHHTWLAQKKTKTNFNKNNKKEGYDKKKNVQQKVWHGKTYNDSLKTDTYGAESKKYGPEVEAAILNILHFMNANNPKARVVKDKDSYSVYSKDVPNFVEFWNAAVQNTGVQSEKNGNSADNKVISSKELGAFALSNLLFRDFDAANLHNFGLSGGKITEVDKDFAGNDFVFPKAQLLKNKTLRVIANASKQQESDSNIPQNDNEYVIYEQIDKNKKAKWMLKYHGYKVGKKELIDVDLAQIPELNNLVRNLEQINSSSNYIGSVKENKEMEQLIEKEKENILQPIGIYRVGNGDDDEGYTTQKQVTQDINDPIHLPSGRFKPFHWFNQDNKKLGDIYEQAGLTKNISDEEFKKGFYIELVKTITVFGGTTANLQRFLSGSIKELWIYNNFVKNFHRQLDLFKGALLDDEKFLLFFLQNSDKIKQEVLDKVELYNKENKNHLEKQIGKWGVEVTFNKFSLEVESKKLLENIKSKLQKELQSGCSINEELLKKICGGVFSYYSFERIKNPKKVVDFSTLKEKLMEKIYIPNFYGEIVRRSPDSKSNVEVTILSKKELDKKLISVGENGKKGGLLLEGLLVKVDDLIFNQLSPEQLQNVQKNNNNENNASIINKKKIFVEKMIDFRPKRFVKDDMNNMELISSVLVNKFSPSKTISVFDNHTSNYNNLYDRHDANFLKLGKAFVEKILNRGREPVLIKIDFPAKEAEEVNKELEEICVKQYKKILVLHTNTLSLSSLVQGASETIEQLLNESVKNFSIPALVKITSAGFQGSKYYIVYGGNKEKCQYQELTLSKDNKEKCTKYFPTDENKKTDLYGGTIQTTLNCFYDTKSDFYLQCRLKKTTENSCSNANSVGSDSSNSSLSNPDSNKSIGGSINKPNSPANYASMNNIDNKNAHCHFIYYIQKENVEKLCKTTLLKKAKKVYKERFPSSDNKPRPQFSTNFNG